MKSLPISNQPVPENVFKEGNKGDKRVAGTADFDSGGTSMRRLENYIRKYGPEFGPRLYHALQSQAAHAGVSARLRRKIEVLAGKTPASPRKTAVNETLPLFPEAVSLDNASPDSAGQTAVPENAQPLAIGA
jgi:hypothetical protein